MKEKRESARKRRAEEEQEAEVARKERLKAKMAALEGAGQSRQERQAAKEAAAATPKPSTEQAAEAPSHSRLLRSSLHSQNHLMLPSQLRRALSHRHLNRLPPPAFPCLTNWSSHCQPPSPKAPACLPVQSPSTCKGKLRVAHFHQKPTPARRSSRTLLRLTAHRIRHSRLLVSANSNLSVVCLWLATMKGSRLGLLPAVATSGAPRASAMVSSTAGRRSRLC